MGSVTSALTRRTRHALVKVGSEPEHETDRSLSAPKSDHGRQRSVRLNVSSSNQIGRQSTRQSLSEELNAPDAGGGRVGTSQSALEPSGNGLNGEFSVQLSLILNYIQ